MRAADREKQMAEAEEMLGDRLQKIGFAKGLFFGRYAAKSLAPYPEHHAVDAASTMVAELKAFCEAKIDPDKIDREATIPREVIEGLGRLGVLGACLPTTAGGRGLSQTDYCRIVEVLGGHCASTALFVNAHHSIGPRAIVLFGTSEQQQTWLPKLASGEWISAFALTEPEAGSDAANVRTTATPTPDGLGYRINGKKRWITNGGISQVLTVMARTPVAGGGETKITAFIVTPDMPGFEVVEPRMEKMGVRGTATGRLAFNDMYVPKENVLGQLGKGLKVALTVLDYGRTTFGASCTGAAKYCLKRALAHARTRVQFGQTLGSFELVKEKLAAMASSIYAMEAATLQTAALIDSGVGEFLLETAMLKVFATEELWRIVNDVFQIHGGKAYFTDEPFERIVRDARINMIGEGANDVLRSFIALVGMRDVGLELKGVLEAAQNPLRNLGKLSGFAGRRLESMFASPAIEVATPRLQEEASQLARLVGQFGSQVEKLLRTHGESVLDRQYLQGRVGDAAIDLYVCASVLRRLDAALADEHHEATTTADFTAAMHFLHVARRRIQRNFVGLASHDDELTTQLADQLLGPNAPE